MKTMIALAERSNRSARLLGKRPNPVVIKARHILSESPLFRGRSGSIRIDESDGQLVLEGNLPSFYLKQMLQTLLRNLEGVERIDNRIVVDWPLAE